MSHADMTPEQAAKYNNFSVGISNATVGQIKFGVDNTDAVVREPFPSVFHVLDSVEFITYDKVLKAFTDEDTFFKLQCVTQITGENQRYIGPVSLDDGTDNTTTGIIVTLPGVIDPGEAYSLYTEVQKAGHIMHPVRRFGRGGCSFTAFKIIPKV
ncbi:hypothetical protein D9M71_472180 [compost metagenome]